VSNVHNRWKGEGEMSSIKEWLLGKKANGIRDVRVNTALGVIEEAEREARRNTNGGGKRRGRRKPLDLVGTAEAAEMLGVERPRIGRWKKSGVLPDPVAELAAGPVWFRDQIEGVLAERERRRRVPAK
jgi:hypothetical protein